ncbi:N-myristoyl transferase [Acrodontium crateriforme]|uniref:Glycylpeptide N-tetradecanoyltransferase n=1 Tax=Acrodontium crateriforme TaxID=150365 RepID=A0AAQ3R6T9_9PEZI|nr:N-myristoyl transferase [Acrodontium crateriforme]
MSNEEKAVEGEKPQEEQVTASASTIAGLTAQNPIASTDIPALLQQLQLAQAGGKREGKAPEDYKFWNTQPVPKFKEPDLLQTTEGENGETLAEGAILPDAVCKKAAKPEPEKLLDGFVWCEVDLDDKSEMKELYELLYNYYVEDSDGSFRFDYSEEFLAWALKPPGWKKVWHVGVRTKPAQEGKKGKLVAFIAGVPVNLNVRENSVKATEINFLTIHRKLRNKRLAPVLIKEITRRCYLNGIYQALYTAGTLLPKPVSTCRYFHRSLDWEHLYKVGFSHLPRGSTELRQRLKYKLDTTTKTPGLRLMEPKDVPAVQNLLSRYSTRFNLRQNFTEEEVAHYLCSDASKGVVWTYVVEEKGKITDFMSYYLLESTVLRENQKNDTIRAAYLYYYASESAFPGSKKAGAKLSTEQQAKYQQKLQGLAHDMLITAKQHNLQVFNALSLLDNPLFLKEEKFEPGDGKLHYYLFNWRTAPLPNGTNEQQMLDPTNMGGVGVVML